MSKQNQIIVKTYKGIQGSQEQAIAAFQADSALMAAQDYYPMSQSWIPGSYSGELFILALILCIFVVGFFIFIYMLTVKPAGTLLVTYELRLS